MVEKVRENCIIYLHRSIWVFRTRNSVQGLRLRVGPLESCELVLLYYVRHGIRRLRVQISTAKLHSLAKICTFNLLRILQSRNQRLSVLSYDLLLSLIHLESFQHLRMRLNRLRRRIREVRAEQDMVLVLLRKADQQSQGKLIGRQCGVVVESSCVL